ncbi:hypothetical protein BVRB_4g089510 [Beta vulgaris subsp. vulgaris]|nr:hypothetical protein BVRB_4g089510 [Beta vulgaris subsp. vulgaris]
MTSIYRTKNTCTGRHARSRTMSDGEVSDYARSTGRRGFARRRDLICWATTICEKTRSSGRRQIARRRGLLCDGEVSDSLKTPASRRIMSDDNMKREKFTSAPWATQVTFKKPIGSVSVSGHKFLGCPMPCGVQIVRKKHINALSRNIEYIASKDATITGSRNGHTPIFLWYALNRKGYHGLQKDVQMCMRNADYLKGRLKEFGVSVMLNKLSNTVVFERPQDEEFIRRWQLACEGNIAHVIVMPHVTIEKLDTFLNELVEKRLTWFKDGGNQPPCVASELGKENCACPLH